MTGRGLMFLGGYVPARLVELAAVVLLVVIALELRAILNSVSAAKGPG